MEKLPVRYLGVPLISIRLLAKYCQNKTDKLANRIRGWAVKTLSYGCNK